MTDLRTAAQQALEAMESAEVDPHSSDAVYKAITALKAALTEDAMQKFTDVNQELMAALGCDHCNSPLYAATRCRVCGRETPIIEPEIKGDNKPVAWIHTDPDKPRVKFLEWRENEPGYRGDWIKTPLYTAPPK